MTYQEILDDIKYHIEFGDDLRPETIEVLVEFFKGHSEVNFDEL